MNYDLNINNGPNWVSIYDQLNSTKEESIGNISIEILKQTVDILEKNWTEVKARRLKSGVVLHLRPSDVPAWKLPLAIDTDGKNIVVRDKEIFISSTYKTLRLGAYLNTLQPTLRATLRYEDSPYGTEHPVSAKWVEDSALREVGFLNKFHDNPDFVHMFLNAEYLSKNSTVRKMAIAMEYCNLHDLREALPKYPDLLDSNLPNLINVTRSLLSSLHSLYKKGVLHRDIKMENYFLHQTPEGVSLKLGDFGLSAMATQEVKRLSNSAAKVGGSMDTIAPEVLFGNENRHIEQNAEFLIKSMCSRKTDVWSAGIVLYELIIGDTPSFASLIELTYDIDRNTQWDRLISDVLNGTLLSENCAEILMDDEQEEIREFYFDLIRQMLVLDQSKRASAEDLWKQFEEFEANVLPKYLK